MVFQPVVGTGLRFPGACQTFSSKPESLFWLQAPCFDLAGLSLSYLRNHPVLCHIHSSSMFVHFLLASTPCERMQVLSKCRKILL